MITPELKSYVQNLKSSGYSNEQIAGQLRAAGWQELDITSVLSGQTPQPVVTPQTLPLKWIIVGIVLLVLVSSLIVSYFYLNGPKDKSGGRESFKSPSPTFAPVVVTSPTPDTSVTLAPPGTPEFSRTYYRSHKATIAEAQDVQKKLGSTFGSVVVPDDIFVHEEEYKGIKIKWTSGQPIPIERLAWLKTAIDILPEYFYKDHPATAIISATHQELGSKGSNPRLMGAIAYASGLNIFFTSIYTGDPLYQVTQKDATAVLFHEYVHVVQQYEMLQTFTEKYMSIPGNSLVAFTLTPFSKEFAKAVGWVFQYDEYAGSTYAILSEDTESQKATDYGKTKYVEDMAETAANFLTCNTSGFSQARIVWMEKVTSKKASDFCPPRF